ncbi:hypothetical protein ACLOAV_010176 [Pseudogymnoascus australis]
MLTDASFKINVKNGITKDPYPGSTSRNPTYSCLKVDGIQSIANSSLLSDERHILFYSQIPGEERQLSIVDHSTLECRTFTSGELSKENAAWPQSGWDKLAAWHSGSVLLYNGNPLKAKEEAEQRAKEEAEQRAKEIAEQKARDKNKGKSEKRAQNDVSFEKLSFDGGPEQPSHTTTLKATQVEQISDVSEDFSSWDLTALKSFDIDLNKPSLSKGSDIKIPDDLRCFDITALSMDQNYTYVAFDSNPRRILVFSRNDNSPVARLVVPAPADPGKYDFNQISGIVIRKDCIAATTLVGHIAIWDRQLLVGAKNNVDIRPSWMSTKLDSLGMGLPHLIEQVSMSQDCQRMVVSDPLWCLHPAYISRPPGNVEKFQTIPARKREKRADSLLRVDEDCCIAAVGVAVRTAATPKLEIFDANKDNLLMTFSLSSLGWNEYLGEFRDLSLERRSIKYYGTKGIVSVDFAEEEAMPDDIYRCSRNIPFNVIFWGGVCA